MLLPFEQEIGKEGTRLYNLEVLNWGTFHKKIYNFEPKGGLSLLTGSSGTGKSTLVDALLTLLVSPRRVSYNKAADSSAKERTINTYVLGYYGRKYHEDGKGEAVSLRDKKYYSVILANFYQEQQQKFISLAIFFYFTNSSNSPERIYIVSEKKLSIKESFSNFQGDISLLKNSLKKQGASLFSSYSEYSEKFRKLLGKLSEQAIDLFQQTVSMKKVDALNEFVKKNMLDAENISDDIENLLQHYKNLYNVYQSILRAKEQTELLNPISQRGKEYTSLVERHKELELAKEALIFWFATHHKNLLKQEIFSLEEQENKLQGQVEHLKAEIEYIGKEILKIERKIAVNGGEELGRIEEELAFLEKDKERCQKNRTDYNQNAEKLGLMNPNSFEIYEENQKKMQEIKNQKESSIQIFNEELKKININIYERQKEEEEISRELSSLQARKSNIPTKCIEIREALCKSLQISVEKLPFVGELLEVKETESKWEGAIEKLLHSFGISLLVPEQYYTKVAAWVNGNFLNTKLVYYKIKQEYDEGKVEFQENSVASKLRIKEETAFTFWLASELEKRFPHKCCDSLEEFIKERIALSIFGQIKYGIRHEKNDYERLEDRSKYVLGFSNKKKIQLLDANLQSSKMETKLLQDSHKEIENKQKKCNRDLLSIANLQRYNFFDDLDLEAILSKMIEKEKLKEKLQRENENLFLWEKEKEEQEQKRLRMEEEKEKNQKLKAKIEERKAQALQKEEKLTKIQDLENEKHRESYSFLEENLSTFVKYKDITLENIEDIEKQYSYKIDEQTKELHKQSSQLKDKINSSINLFHEKYPEDAIDLYRGIEALEDYNQLLSQLLYHNLPKYQIEFQSELRTKILMHITMLQGKLQQYQENISKKINQINQSLEEIDYNPGRYILIKYEKNKDVEIQKFKEQLRLCTSNITSEQNEQELEEKFLQIHSILERFQGREQYTEIDKKWTQKVTDVRNWFIFSASERDRNSGEEYEHYSDSDGKSGGQKEKLAYTILGASLAYNYKLNSSKEKTHAFRLVVIDEAFLKSSDDSATFGLNLFKKMNFQLLVVTPFVKIDTIEPFVSHIGMVTFSDEKHESSLQNISIETYRENKK